MQIEPSTSTASRQQLVLWRAFLESAYALLDILEVEMQAEAKLSLRWYDVLVHLEDAADGLRMTEVADRILASKGGLTRVIDRMVEAGLARREQRPGDRRVVLVVITSEGLEALARARVVHRRGILEHFSSQLDDEDSVALTKAFAQVRSHVRPLRPGRVSG